MARSFRKAHGSSVPAKTICTGDSSDTIIYCTGFPSSAATILDAIVRNWCLCSASMDLLVVILKYGMAAPFDGAHGILARAEGEVENEFGWAPTFQRRVAGVVRST